MSCLTHFRKLGSFAACFLCLLLAAPAKDETGKEKSRLRMVCLSCLEEDQKVIVASKDAQGAWREHGAAELRSSSITDWMPATPGEMHLVLKDADQLRVICSFTYPDNIRNALVVLNVNADKSGYEAHVIDAQTAGFDKGSVLLMNLSQIAGVLRLGTDEYSIEAGQQLVAKPVLEETGMYRLMASSIDAEGKSIVLHDRFVSGKPDARGMVFLLPHKARGMRLVSLPLFGDLN